MYFTQKMNQREKAREGKWKEETLEKNTLKSVCKNDSTNTLSMCGEGTYTCYIDASWWALWAFHGPLAIIPS